MIYIFLDESGDLGFDFSKKKTSKSFIITVLLAKNKNIVDKIIKKVYQSFSQKQIERRRNYLHCNNEDETTRMKLYNELSKRDVKIASIYFDKTNCKNFELENKHNTYNNLIIKILEYLFAENIINNTERNYLIASRRDTNKKLKLNFIEEIETKFSNQNLFVEIIPAGEEKGLQVVDFVSYALFNKYEYQELKYYNIFKHLIVNEWTI